MMPGLFISFEGGEGVGKSTLIKGLNQKLLERDLESLITREPGGSQRGEELRRLLLETSNDMMSVESELLIINAARSDHVDNVIRPALKRGAIVLCDRFSDSSRAYQGEQIAQNALESVITLATKGMEPDLTVLLDAAPEDLLDRRLQRGGTADRFEARGLTFHNQVRQRFLNIAKMFPERIFTVDAMRSPEDIVETVLKLIDERFPALKSQARQTL